MSDELIVVLKHHNSNSKSECFILSWKRNLYFKSKTSIHLLVCVTCGHALWEMKRSLITDPLILQNEMPLCRDVQSGSSRVKAEDRGIWDVWTEWELLRWTNFHRGSDVLMSRFPIKWAAILYLEVLKCLIPYSIQILKSFLCAFPPSDNSWSPPQSRPRLPNSLCATRWVLHVQNEQKAFDVYLHWNVSAPASVPSCFE